jgi:hypothetical protein
VPICPQGSRPKAGQPEWFLFEPIQLFGPFSNIAGWLSSALLNLPNTPVRTVDFCSQEPPQDLPTTQDWLSIFIPLVAAASGTYGRIANLVKNTEYSNRCECAPSSGTGCTSRSLALEWAPGSPTGSACGSNTWYLGFPGNENHFPAQQHQVKVRIANVITTHDVQVDIYSSTIGERCFTWLANTGFEVNFTGQLADSAWFMAFRDAGQPLPWLVGLPVLIDYSAAPGEPPCGNTGTPIPLPNPEPPPAGMPGPPALACSTIADVCAQLQQLAIKVDAISNLVTLLQRWSKPFAYVQGAEHAGLTGEGSIVIDRVLGMRVYVVQPPPDKPVLPGNPPYLWDVGWMAIANSDGMIEEKRITRSGFDWFPHDMPLASTFQWALNTGVVLTVVEMRAEP